MYEYNSNKLEWMWFTQSFVNFQVNFQFTQLSERDFILEKISDFLSVQPEIPSRQNSRIEEGGRKRLRIEFW